MLEQLKNIFIPTMKNGFLPKGLGNKPLFWYGAGILMVKIAVISLILTLPATNLFSAISSQRLFNLINEARQEKNLTPLALNNKLATAAELKTEDMINKDYFEHTSPSGVTPWYWFKIAGYNFTYAGENLAMDFFETDAVFQTWMNSPSHRDNILNPDFKEIGIAVNEGKIQEHQTTLAVLTFGSQAASAQKLPPAVSPKTPTPNVIKSPEPTTPTPSVSAPSAPAESQIPLKTVSGALTPSPSLEISSSPVALVDTSGIESAPRVLGAFTSRLDEIVKSLYLYFTLFLIIALAVNIFVKIRIQHWATIATTSGLIILSGVLVFI
jgi:hypothetical protein